jgi:hypothetical protein
VQGTNVVQKPASASGILDDWCFVPVDDGYFAVINMQTGTGLDVPHWNLTEGSILVLWGYQASYNQQFKVTLAANGTIATTEEPPPPTLPPQTGNPDATAPWDGPHATPVIAVAIASLPNGNILMWSAFLRDQFDYDTTKTWTAIYDPETDDITEKLVENTSHDMVGTHLVLYHKMMTIGSHFCSFTTSFVREPLVLRTVLS